MSLVQLRLAHWYAGVFFAPTISFFALSSVFQIFKLHEAYRQVPGAQGDWVAFNYPKRRRAFYATLGAGILIPIILLQLGAA